MYLEIQYFFSVHVVCTISYWLSKKNKQNWEYIEKSKEHNISRYDIILSMKKKQKKSVLRMNGMKWNQIKINSNTR